MSYRGGGFSRGGGGYRGRGGEGSWRGSRGTFTSRGGGGGGGGGRFYSSNPSNYESRSRNYFQGGNDRFSNRGRADDSYRSYRQESQDYSNRDFGMRSPEPPRKRMRGDSFSGGPARRSHERSFGSGGNDYQSRNFYISDKSSGGGYPGDKGSFRDLRESRSSDFSFRKPGLSSRSPRGSFRGRSFSRGRIRGRGFNRSGISSRALLTRRRTETFLRKRFMPSKSQDYLRRLKLYRLKRDDKKNKKGDEDDNEEIDELEDKDEDDCEELSSQDDQEEEAEENEDRAVEGETEENSEEKKEEGNEDEEKVEKAETPSPSKKKEVKQATKKVVKKAATKKVKVTEGEANSNEEKSGGEEEEGKLINFLGQPFIRLKCPHCGYTCVTFQEYGCHLGMKKHQTAMRTVSAKIHRTLTKMRVDQRQKQRTLDELSEGNMNLRTFFCTICKLNYRTLKSQHENTAAHKKMQDFLYPFCKICRMSFRTPMLYEAHICDLVHIKRKAKWQKKRPAQADEDKDGSDSANELDADGFMVLDAVGSGDDSEGDKPEHNEDGTEKTEEEKKLEKEAEKAKAKKAESVKLGVEYCKVVQSYYCELCKIFLPRSEDMKRAITLHCRSRIHLQRWMREVKFQRRKAALMKAKKEENKEKKEEEVEADQSETKKEEKESENKEGEAKVENKDSENQEGEKPETVKQKNTEDGEKVWTEVDKDLTDLLNDLEEEKISEDEDEDSRRDSSRFDRFKHDKSLEKPDDQKEDDEEKETNDIKKATVTNTQANGNISEVEKNKIEEVKPVEA